MNYRKVLTWAVMPIFFLIFNINTFAKEEHKHEIKAGLLKHDLAYFGGGKDEKGLDVNLEYVRKIDYKWAPYMNVGGTYNPDGGTDLFYVSAGYRLIRNSFYGHLDIGLTYHTDKADACSVLPREAIAVGYEFSDRFKMELFLDHISDAWCCEPNDSMETGGLRVGFGF